MALPFTETEFKVGSHVRVLDENGHTSDALAGLTGTVVSLKDQETFFGSETQYKIELDEVTPALQADFDSIDHTGHPEANPNFIYMYDDELEVA